MIGLLGTVSILALFAVMAVAMARVLMRCTSGFERIVTGGILAWLIGQAFVNIGMVTAVLPVIGVPLPFISYGGSSLLMCLSAVGVVMSFARQPSVGMVESVPPPRARAVARRRPLPADDAYDAYDDDGGGGYDDLMDDEREPIAEVHDIRRGRAIRRRGDM